MVYIERIVMPKLLEILILCNAFIIVVFFIVPWIIDEVKTNKFNKKMKEKLNKKKEKFEMNLNEFAVKVSELESGKQELDISQIKSVIKAIDIASHGAFYKILEKYWDTNLTRNQLLKEVGYNQPLDKELRKFKGVRDFQRFASMVCRVEKGKRQVNIAQVSEVLKVANKLIDGTLYLLIKRIS